MHESWRENAIFWMWFFYGGLISVSDPIVMPCWLAERIEENIGDFDWEHEKYHNMANERQG